MTLRFSCVILRHRDSYANSLAIHLSGEICGAGTLLIHERSGRSGSASGLLLSERKSLSKVTLFVSAG